MVLYTYTFYWHYILEGVMSYILYIESSAQYGDVEIMPA